MKRDHIDLVVFDAGGVLLRICRSWAEACEQAGEPFHSDIASPEAMSARKALVRQYEVGGLPCEAYFSALAASTQGRYSAAQVERIHRAWIIGEYPGVARLVADLHEAGRATALLSNTNHAHWEQFPTFEVMRTLRARHGENVHASHLLRCAKPDPTVYERFAQATGQSPSGILFFDDLAENVHAAQAAGWSAELIDFRGDTAAQMRRVLRAVGMLSIG